MSSIAARPAGTAPYAVETVAPDVDTTAIEAVLPAVTQVLREEGIIATSDNAKWNEMEARGFESGIVEYAKDGAKWGYHEITHWQSNTRLIVKVRITKEGVATLTEIDAYDHPRPSDKIDYEALSLKLQRAAGISE